MNKTKIGIVLLASLIGMLLCSGVASADPDSGNCCSPSTIEGDICYCDQEPGTDEEAENTCVNVKKGIWMGQGGCDRDTNKPCDEYCTEGGECVPEMSTIALLATGLIGMVGYLGLRRKEE